MKIVQAAERKWLANQLRHRKGNILIKEMLEGEDGRFTPKTTTEILSITIPSVAALGLKAA